MGRPINAHQVKQQRRAAARAALLPAQERPQTAYELLPSEQEFRSADDGHPSNLCFRTHSHTRSGKRRSSDDIYDDLGFVDRIKLYDFISKLPGGHTCVICGTHHEQTLEGIARHILDVHGHLAGRGHNPERPCLYSVYTSHRAVYSRGGAGQFIIRFDGLLGDWMYHILPGHVYTCHCGLPFSCTQLLAVHIMSCTVQQPKSCGPSLYF